MKRIADPADAFVGRRHALADLEAWAASRPERIFELTGSYGTGKTALLTHVVERGQIGGVEVVAAILRDPRAGTDEKFRDDSFVPSLLAARMCAGIRALLPEGAREASQGAEIYVTQVAHTVESQTVTLSLNANGSEFSELGRLAARLDHDVLVVVDALDEAADVGDLAFIPFLGELARLDHVRVLCSSRLKSPLPRRPKVLSRDIIHDYPDDSRDIRDFVTSRLGDEGQLVDTIVGYADSLFLYARVAVNEVLAGRIQEPQQLPTTVAGFYENEMKRLQARFADPEQFRRVRNALGVVAAAFGDGLVLSDVQDAAGLRSDQEALDLLEAVSHYWTIGDRIAVIHPSFARFIFGTFDESPAMTGASPIASEVEAHLKIIHTLLGRYSTRLGEDSARYARNHLVEHLRLVCLRRPPDERAEAIETLRECARLIVSPEYCEVRFACDGLSALLHDLASARDAGSEALANTSVTPGSLHRALARVAPGLSVSSPSEPWASLAASPPERADPASQSVIELAQELLKSRHQPYLSAYWQSDGYGALLRSQDFAGWRPKYSAFELAQMDIQQQVDVTRDLYSSNEMWRGGAIGHCDFNLNSKEVLVVACGGCAIWDIEGAELRTLFDPTIDKEAYVRSASWSQDGTAVAILRVECTGIRESIEIVDSRSGALLSSFDLGLTHRVPEQSFGFASEVVWVTGAANGTAEVATWGQSTVALWSLSDGSAIPTFLPTRGDKISGVAFADGGKRYAVMSANGLGIYAHHDGRWMLDREADQSSQSPIELVWSSSGDLGVFAGDIRILLSNGGERLLGAPVDARRPWERDRMIHGAWAPDGSLIAGRGPETGVHVWSLAEDKEIAEPVPANDSGSGPLAWSPSGQFLVTAGCGPTDLSVRLWEVAALPEPGIQSSPLSSSKITCAGQSSDGANIYTVSSDAVRLLDARTGIELKSGGSLRPWMSMIGAGEVSPDMSMVTVCEPAMMFTWSFESFFDRSDDLGPHGSLPFDDLGVATMAANQVAWSPSRSLVLLTFDDRGVVLRRRTTTIYVAEPRRFRSRKWSPLETPVGFQVLYNFGIRATAQCTAWLPDDHLVALDGEGRVLRMSFSDGQMAVADLESETGWDTLAVHGETMALSDANKSIIVGEEAMVQLSGPCAVACKRMAWTSNGRTLFGSRNHCVTAWSAADGSVIAHASLPATGPLLSLSASGPGASMDGVVVSDGPRMAALNLNISAFVESST